jgi:putative copper resistance protein D
MGLVLLRFLESAPAALAVGLLLLPRLINEDGARFKPAVALLAAVRAGTGFFLLVAIARSIIPAQRSIDLSTLVEFTFGTVVGKAWVATQIAALAFASLAIARLFVSSDLLDRITLWSGVLLIASVSVTGHAIDDSLPVYTQISFLLHTGAGLTWLGGLLGLVWWMATARGKPPETARRLAERWSFVAKVAMAIVVASGLALAWENVASFPNLLATPYGRLLTLKLAFLCAVLLLALALARYITRAPAGNFDTNWYWRVGAAEAAFGVALLFLAGWIAVITPASHETDLYWPLPFRISWAATWGYKVPMWSDVWWWGVGGLVFAIVAAAVWFIPNLRRWRRFGTPVAGAAGFLCLIVSLSVQAYPDTYNDPTQDYTAESIARGYDFFQNNCIGCHGPMGDGNGVMAKDLKVPPADLTAPHVGTHTIGDIFHWLTFGGQSGVMPAFAEQLEVDDRWDVINFLLILSSTNQSRFLSPKGVIQWLIAPDFALIDPKDEITSLSKLRGAPTLISFADCRAGAKEKIQGLDESLKLAAETARANGAHHVTVYKGECPADTKGREPSHPKAVEIAYAVINRYLDEPFSLEIPEGHFLIDRSGYVRARFRHFAPDDGSPAALRAQILLTAKEPIVKINLHSH